MIVYTRGVCISSLLTFEQHCKKKIAQRLFLGTISFQGILFCDLFYAECGNCSKKRYGGPKNSIHVWSKYTAAGQELGWDFISNVRKLNGCSFSGFCDMMTHYYQSGVHTRRSFMSKTTFIQWFFSFVAAFQIDFRQEVSTIILY